MKLFKLGLLLFLLVFVVVALLSAFLVNRRVQLPAAAPVQAVAAKAPAGPKYVMWCPECITSSLPAKVYTSRDLQSGWCDAKWGSPAAIQEKYVLQNILKKDLEYAMFDEYLSGSRELINVEVVRVDTSACSGWTFSAWVQLPPPPTPLPPTAAPLILQPLTNWIGTKVILACGTEWCKAPTDPVLYLDMNGPDSCVDDWGAKGAITDAGVIANKTQMLKVKTEKCEGWIQADDIDIDKSR